MKIFPQNFFLYIFCISEIMLLFIKQNITELTLLRIGRMLHFLTSVKFNFQNDIFIFRQGNPQLLFSQSVTSLQQNVHTYN